MIDRRCSPFPSPGWTDHPWAVGGINHRRWISPAASSFRAVFAGRRGRRGCRGHPEILSTIHCDHPQFLTVAGQTPAKRRWMRSIQQPADPEPPRTFAAALQIDASRGPIPARRSGSYLHVAVQPRRASQTSNRRRSSRTGRAIVPNKYLTNNGNIARPSQVGE